MDDPSSSPLLEAWPVVAMMLDDDPGVRADVDRMLSDLLPLARSEEVFARGPVWLGATISNDGSLERVRDGRYLAWGEEDGLVARLDALVAADEVRAVAQCERVILRRSDGIHDWTYTAIRVLAEHRDGFSHDLLMPLDWATIRRPDVMDPQSVDRIAAGYPHRAWPGADGVPALDAEAAYRNYVERDEYEELHRAIAIAEHDLGGLADDDGAWPATADRLAEYLGARFRHSGDGGDLDRALTVARAAFERSGGDADRRAHLARLLGLRFVRDGRLSLLEEAIAEARAADAAAPDAETAETLAELLLMRYRATAERELPEEALSILYGAARRLRAAGQEVTAGLAATMGSAHIERFDQGGERDQIENAIGAIDYALEALGGGPDFARRLRDGAIARQRYYELTHDDAKLQVAYASLQLALRATHDKSPERAPIRLALASLRVHRLPRERLVELMEHESMSLEDIERFEQMELPPAWLLLNQAIAHATEVLGELPEGSPERSAAHAVLANLHRDAYEQGGDADQLRRAAGAAADGAAEWAASFAEAPVAQKLGVSAQGAELYEYAIDALLELAGLDGRFEAEAHSEAFRLAEAAKSRLLTERLGRGDVAVRHDVPRRLVRHERDLLAELVALDTAALAARDSGVGFRPDSERRERIAAELDAVWAQMEAHGPSGAEYVALRRGDALELMQMRDVVMSVSPAGAVLSLYVLDDQTVLFVAGSDGSGFGVEQVPLGRGEWTEVLRRFGNELPRSYGRDLMPPTWELPLRPLLAKMAERLIGCGHLLIVPHGPAHALPWSYLTRDLQGPDGGAPAVSVLPALAVLDRIHKRPATAARGAFVMGNPTGDLLEAESEAEAVGRVLNVEALTGPDATRSKLDAAAAKARVLHLACHAEFEPENPLDSYILLADGRWRARDALSSRLDAELVVLSACETGLAGELAGEQLAGLSQAFLHAGARAVIVSLWRISDAAAEELMRVFHERRAAGTPSAVALREAAEAVRREREHPWYWAAFTLNGG